MDTWLGEVRGYWESSRCTISIDRKKIDSINDYFEEVWKPKWQR